MLGAVPSVSELGTPHSWSALLWASLVPGPVSEPGKVVESCPSETSLPADLEHWGSDQDEEGADGADPQAGGSLAGWVQEVP